MKIYEQEKLDGIANLLSSSASISYASVAEPCSSTRKLKNIKILASIEDSDLYYVQSILVSSSWNKNDDIFDGKEIWAARNTPEDKPTNLEHDETTIIGHITSNWPITEDGNLIDDNTDPNNLPNKFHILTGSVIYKVFTNPDLKARADQLISEIKNGEKYVSMECFFKNFDYGLIDKSNGSYHILPRNEATAYLTKYLRAYGGDGEHQNYKIGRVLRNITFSGKGFVNRPANPDSIIFNKNLIPDEKIKNSEIKNNNLAISGVSNNQSNLNVENYTMSLDKEVAELQAKVEALETELVTKNNDLATLQSSYDALAANTAEAAKKMKEDEDAKDEENKNLKAALEVANEVIAGYKTKEEEMMKKEKKMKRMASLVDSGLDQDTATATVEKFENLEDEAFDALAQILVAAVKKKVAQDEEDQEEKNMSKKASVAETKASSNNTDTESLDNVEVENDINLGVAGDADADVQTTRAALVEFVCHRLGKNLNKGE